MKTEQRSWRTAIRFEHTFVRAAQVSLDANFGSGAAGEPAAAPSDLDADEALFSGEPTGAASVCFEMDSAYQGAEALAKVRASQLPPRHPHPGAREV